jgi:hypothetical protein
MSPLVRATAIGTALQVAMVVAGHFVPALRDPGFAIGGMGLSAVAGWLSVGSAGLAASLGGGALAGGVCAALGIAVSVAFGDVPPSLLLLGTGASVVTGAIGAGLAHWRR